MKYIALLFAAFLLSCSDDVKSSENYIERFEIDGISPIEINIRPDASLVYVWTDSSNIDALKNAVPSIKVSAGASISMSGSDWTESGFKYTVKAENGDTRSYSVQIDMDVPRRYSFETWKLSDGNYKYYIPSNLRWSSGNAGIAMALAILKVDVQNPENYPTQKTEKGKEGNAVLMKTMNGGNVFGRSVPLISGNFFLGDFDASKAITDELAATKLGRIYPGKPKAVRGYYKYAEGQGAFMNNGEEEPGRNDSCNMSIRFYLSDGDTTLTVKDIDSSELVIASKDLDDCSDTGGEFKEFELELDYSENYSPESRYKLAITFAASRNGDKYAGKIGSEFIVDEIEIEDY